MFKLIGKAKKNQKGFTLVELMVVVIIIGILVAIAIPVYGSVQTNAANRAHEANIRTLKGAGQMLIAEAGGNAAGTYTSKTSTSTAGGFTLGGYVEVWPNVPDRANILDATQGTAQTYQVAIAGSAGAFTVTVTVINGTATN